MRLVDRLNSDISVGISRSMTQEVFDGGRGFRDPRLTIFPDLGVFKLRQVFGDGVLDAKFTSLNQHHCGNRSNSFCHGIDTKDGVCLHGLFVFDVAEAKRLRVDNFSSPGNHHGGSGNVLLTNQRLNFVSNQLELFRGHTYRGRVSDG